MTIMQQFGEFHASMETHYLEARRIAKQRRRGSRLRGENSRLRRRKDTSLNTICRACRHNTCS
jgi:hypothetical protein